MTIGKITQKEEFVVEWSIPNFLYLPAKVNSSYKSASFHFADASWYLKIFPNFFRFRGFRETKGCIGLYFCITSSESPIKLEFSLGIKTADGDVDSEMQFLKLFEVDDDDQGSPEFSTRKELQERKSELLPSGTLTLICRIKRPNITEFASGVATPKCSLCKEVMDTKSLSAHEKKCMLKPIKCPVCSSVVLLKNWYEHECETSKAEGASNASTSSVFPPKKENCDIFFKVKEEETHDFILAA